jgi:hypothetical protein
MSSAPHVLDLFDGAHVEAVGPGTFARGQEQLWSRAKQAGDSSSSAAEPSRLNTNFVVASMVLHERPSPES